MRNLIRCVLASVVLAAPIHAYSYLSVGDAAPDFTVYGLDSQPISLSDYSDKVVVLFLLETTSSRCASAAGAYEQNVYQPYRDQGVVVLGIDINPTGETLDDLASFRDAHSITFPLAMDSDGECWSAYIADDDGNVPVFYVIDTLGTIREIRLGYRSGREEYTIDAIEGIRPSLALNMGRDLNDMTTYLPGDMMSVFADVSNPAATRDVLAYIAVSVGEDLLFWPSYGPLPEGIGLMIPAGFVLDGYPIDSIVVNEAFPPGFYEWMALFVDAATGEWLSDLDSISVPVRHNSRPADDRSSLELPSAVLDYLKSNIGINEAPLGFSETEVGYFGGHELRLKVMKDLFTDITEVPRLSGEIGDFFLENARDPAAIVTYCFQMLEYEEETVTRSAPKCVPPAALQSFMFDTPADETNWNTLQPEVRQFIDAIIDAAETASPAIQAAFDIEFLAQALQVTTDGLNDIERWRLYQFAASPWYGTSDGTIEDGIHRLDLDHLSTGTSTFVSDVSGAITAFRLWLDENEIQPTDFDTIKFTAPAGRCCILGTGDQQVLDEYSIIIDLGGDDIYRGSHAVPRSFDRPVGAIIDLSGNDEYDGGSDSAALCCGLFGVASIFDLQGNDEYFSGPSGIASAWHGSALLIDYEGDDSYFADADYSYWCEGAAHAGIGLLIDLAGSDYYSCYSQGQGFGSTLGFGAILDVSGEDQYNTIGSPSD
ncbi:MAG: redoxin domain-containing protein, partial [Candidatus Coatesbacteria bacterium]|nr:redoxin domain-containing protein [Candidatus Coatesbacteria bacterium]